MVDRAGGGMRFDHGIERIFNMEAGLDDARLPDLASILPSREQIRMELEEVLPEPALARLLDGFLWPEISDGALLAPHGFDAAFAGLEEALREKAGDGDAVIEAAWRLMADEQQTRELLATYRTTLVGA